jgi:hypothetical protein
MFNVSRRSGTAKNEPATVHVDPTCAIFLAVVNSNQRNALCARRTHMFSASRRNEQQPSKQSLCT